MREFFHHLFLPRPSNNHRPKILHHQSLLFFIGIFLLGSIVLQVGESRFSQVLGTATNISIQKLLEETNREREGKGIQPLRLDQELSDAALYKAKNMFGQNYWAHNSPSGDTPWTFFKKAGYSYVYAGENLARGFDKSEEVVDAWMKSSSHRENLLSSYYQDIGFAVVDGELLGEKTTLVVQMFGNKSTVSYQPSSQVSKQGTSKQGLSSQQLAAVYPSIKNVPFIDNFSFSKNIGIGTIALFVVVFVVDMIIITRRKIIRVVGHNIDHIFFLGGMLILLITFIKGVVL